MTSCYESISCAEFDCFIDIKIYIYSLQKLYKTHKKQKLYKIIVLNSFQLIRFFKLFTLFY